ncbi:hypothetical protein BOTCAL_0249g00140 [Botryotinia calthae]|uniref:Altered inheritance of mitochondria protein 9, mitochondrial n=1 Tax=Botryotinia calthae TaxID=38488 RepID=A0A4Y8CWP9_9HELO|nr:hypothetical protein BOTCAL_0249g00140 [Botryotinia calthae]
MHHVAGVPLRERWPSMSGSQYPKCVQAICMTMQQLAALEFPAYGSIYFEDAPLGSEVKIPLSDGFCIGPHCSTVYWDCGVDGSEMGKIVRGSAGKDLAAYASGLIANGHSKLPSTSSPITASRPSYFGTVQEHHKLLDSAEGILQTLIAQPQIANASAPTLLHADLHTRNIYVSDEDPTSITCVIDWQSSTIEPAFIYASDMPDFARAPETSSEEGNPGPEPPLSEQDKMQKVASYCNQTYEICMQHFIPKMRVARSLDALLTRPFQYTHTSWRDSAAALRQEFLDLSSNWENLDLAGPCPYIASPEELARHQKQHRAFERAQELKQMLMKLLFVESDGWVSTEDWEEVRRAHKAIYDLALENAEEEGDDSMTEKNLKELWPFDDGKF